MNLKLKVKFLFLTKNYNTLKKLIVEKENVINYLDAREIEILLEYAAKNEEFILFNTLLLDIIEKNSQMSNLLVDKYIKKYLKVFFHNLIFLYSIASIMSKDPERFSEEIKQIQAFILKEPLSDITIYIHTLNGYYNKEMEDRILNCHHSHFVFCLLENADKNETRRILTKYLKTKPSTKEIYCLASSFRSSKEKLNELKKIILNLEMPKSLKGKYLLSIYDGIKEEQNDLELINNIIDLNDYTTTNKLMERISEEETTAIIKRYIIKKEKSIIFTLACTTDCKETSILIQEALKSANFKELVTLIMLVKEKYLAFVLNQTLKEQSLCLKLINHLYLFGSNRWISIINYMKENNRNLLPEEELKKLLNKIPKEEEILKRKLTLT